MTELRSGKTPLRKIEDFCRQFGLPNLLVKDESKNPFGTWKDRRSEVIIRKARKEFADKLCLITSGNAGFSLAKFAEGSGVKVLAIVDVHLPQSIRDVLEHSCYKAVETNLSETILKTEEVIALARENDQEVIWDVTNGFHAAYQSIITELQDALSDYLICPLGSGEAFVGLFDGLQRAKLTTKLIGVTVAAQVSLADKLYTPWTPYSAKIEQILAAGHQILRLHEEEVASAYAYAKGLMDCEPSSAVVIGALSMLHLDGDSRVVIVNSGKGLL